MNISKATYITSVVSKDMVINDGVKEFAFVGRSNVGKSSLINALVGQKRLAKTSSTAGLTKMVNYFLINESFRFVDLPGYGYAKTSKKQLDVWSSLMGDYLLGSEGLLTVFLLLDCRITPSALDQEMLNFLVYYNLPFKILLTKTDKLSKSQLTKQVNYISAHLGLRKELFMPVSSDNRNGIEDLKQYIEVALGGKDEA